MRLKAHPTGNPGNLGKKGADRLRRGAGPKHQGTAIVSVKAGDNVGVSMIRDLRGVIERDKAAKEADTRAQGKLDL